MLNKLKNDLSIKIPLTDTLTKNDSSLGFTFRARQEKEI